MWNRLFGDSYLYCQKHVAEIREHIRKSKGYVVNMDIRDFWDAVLRQDADSIREYFHSDAWVNWHNTNEHFTVEEFIRANCEYPGEWDGEVEQIFITDTHVITATHVFSKDESISYHATSFIRVEDGKIASVDEYWGDDGPAPQWRQDKHIGTKIRE